MTNKELAEIALNDLQRNGVDVKDDYYEEAQTWASHAEEWAEENSGDGLKPTQHSPRTFEEFQVEWIKSRLQGRLPQAQETVNVAFNQWRKRARKNLYDQHVAEDSDTWEISTERNIIRDNLKFRDKDDG